LFVLLLAGPKEAIADRGAPNDAPRLAFGSTIPRYARDTADRFNRIAVCANPQIVWGELATDQRYNVGKSRQVQLLTLI
jgi:hypothetical protein